MARQKAKSRGLASRSVARGADAGTSLAAGIFQILALMALAIDGIMVPVGALNLNSERVLLGPILLVIPYMAVMNGRMRINGATKLYFCWLVSVIVSALLSFAPSKHFNGVLVSCLPFFYFQLFSERSLSKKSIGLMIEYWLWTVSIGSLLTYFIWVFTGYLENTTDLGRPAFFMFEPNILGAVMAAMMVIHYAFFEKKLSHILLHTLSIFTLILTQSKFPYVAFGITSLYYFIRTGIIKRPLFIFSMVLVLVLVAAVMGYYWDHVQDVYQSNLERKDSVSTRMVVLSAAWDHILEHPIIGNGPLDFPLRNANILPIIGSTDVRDLWIWQMFVFILHDEGLIGLGFFVSFLLALWRYTEAMIAKGYSYFLAFQAGALSIVISSQGTTEHLTATFGVILGLANSLPFAGTMPDRVRKAGKVLKTRATLRTATRHVGARIGARAPG